MTQTIPKRIIKLGGSLLEWNRFPFAITSWLKLQSPCVNLFVIGGGRTADVIREWDQTHQLTNDAAHQLAIEAMSLNAKFVAKLLPNSELLTSINQVEEANDTSTFYLLDAVSLLPQVEAHVERKLPASWDCTSDSIAAFLATHVDRCEELILLKSTLPTVESLTFQTAVSQELVDAYFPTIANDLKSISCVNLRDANFKSVRLVLED